jgi:hypothetical protein
LIERVHDVLRAVNTLPGLFLEPEQHFKEQQVCREVLQLGLHSDQIDDQVAKLFQIIPF